MDRLSSNLSDALTAGHCIVTASPQQAVAIRTAWGQRQLAQQLLSWPTPDVLPLHAWLSRHWGRAFAADSSGRLPRLLTPAQELALWERIVTQTNSGGALAPFGMAQAAMRAWRCLHEWAIEPQALQQGQTEETRAFGQWAQLFTDYTAERGWIDASRALWQCPLQDSVVSTNNPIDNAAGWLAVGFDVPHAALRSLQARLSDAGIMARFAEEDGMQSSSAGAQARCVGLQDAEAELRAAANWTRECLLQNPNAHLLVVVPDAQQRRAQVERLFTESLQPASLLLQETEPETDLGQDIAPFVIEGGVPLAEYPLVNIALTAMELVCRPLPFERVSGWLRSPFLRGGIARAGARARLDLELRRSARYELDLHELLRTVERLGAEAEGEGPLLMGWREFARQLRGPRRLLSQWSADLAKGLAALGWPGDTEQDAAREHRRPLSSTEFQTVDKFHNVLGELAMLDDISGPVDCTGALAQLRRLAQNTLFQPQTSDAPVTVTARLNSPGLRYDGIWVTGMHAGMWPPPARFDPFLPWQAQQAAGIPEVSAAGALALARRITDGLSNSGAHTFFSWPQRLDNEEILPSPLIADLPLLPVESMPGGENYRETLLRSGLGSGQMESAEDGQAPALILPAVVPGGAYTLALQSQCPFRAFATRRLGADVPDNPQAGIDGASRGSFIHRALKMVWDELGTQQSLGNLSPDARHALFVQAAQRAADELLYAQQRWSAALIELECERLVALLEAFAAVELQRAPFRVVGREQRLEVDVAGLILRLSIDRIDELEDGRRLLIDYKTGGVTPAVWYGERPEDPQLPLYVTVSEQTPSAMAFAVLRAEGCVYRGVSAEPVVLPALDAVVKWPLQLAQWRMLVERLATQFAAGLAQVDPITRRVCEYCHLPALCRIDEIDARAARPNEDAAA